MVMMMMMTIIIGDDDDDGATEPAPSPRSRPAPPSPHRAYRRPVRAPAQGTRENHMGHNFLDALASLGFKMSLSE